MHDLFPCLVRDHAGEYDQCVNIPDLQTDIHLVAGKELQGDTGFPGQLNIMIPQPVYPSDEGDAGRQLPDGKGCHR